MWSPNSYGLRNYSFKELRCLSSLQHKRKTDPDIDMMPPVKMHITEEKMVSQLKGIHLSDDYTSHGGPGAEIEETIETRLSDSAFPSLFVCDEIRALKNAVEPILPKALLDKFQRPSTALVLWKPPAGDLGRSLSFVKQSSSYETEPEVQPAEPGDIDMNEEDDNNNGSNNSDMNGLLIR